MATNITTEEIAQSLRARIKAVRGELERYDALRAELTRLETALADLEPHAPRQGRRARKQKPSDSTPRRSRAGARTPASATSPRDGGPAAGRPRGQTRERIIEFIRAQGPSTAGEVAKGLKLNPNSVATRLTQLTKAGELQKAERGYAAPGGNGTSSS